MALLEQHGEDEAGEADDRRKAEVDLAGADDEGKPDREKDERGEGGEEGRVVERLQKYLRRQVHEQDEQQAEHEDDRQAFDALKTEDCLLARHGLCSAQVLCCRSMRYSVSSITVMSFGRISATIAPRSRMISRSATSWT